MSKVHNSNFRFDADGKPIPREVIELENFNAQFRESMSAAIGPDKWIIVRLHPTGGSLRPKGGVIMVYTGKNFGSPGFIARFTARDCIAAVSAVLDADGPQENYRWD